jgi:hypothetical protein
MKKMGEIVLVLLLASIVFYIVRMTIFYTYLLTHPCEEHTVWDLVEGKYMTIPAHCKI